LKFNTAPSRRIIGKVPFLSSLENGLAGQQRYIPMAAFGTFLPFAIMTVTVGF
jgi:hypothetical protein